MLALSAVIAVANWSYELIEFQCHVLIIADRANASLVWSGGIVLNVMTYSMPS